METKRFDIYMPKQDYEIINLTIKENGQAVKLGENDLIFMTVKSSPESETIKFQKSLDNGISYNEETQKYEIVINSEDTENMSINGKYGYDITIFYDGDKPKQKIVGDFIIAKKYSLKKYILNEVV